jgi:hypothetical protein
MFSTLYTTATDKLLYNWLFTVNQFVLVTTLWRLTTSNFISQLNTCSYSPHVTFSLMRDVIYNCCWSKPAQLFSGLSPTGLMTTFCCLSFKTPPNLEDQVPIFISPRKKGGQVIPPGTGFPFRCLLCLAGLQWRYLAPSPHRSWPILCLSSAYITSAWTLQRTPFLIMSVIVIVVIA